MDQIVIFAEMVDMHLEGPTFDSVCNTDLAASVMMEGIVGRVDLGKSMDSAEIIWVMDIFDQLQAVFHLVVPLVKPAGLDFDLAQMYSLNPIVGFDCTTWRPD